jgi:hypothetical protein
MIWLSLASIIHLVVNKPYLEFSDNIFELINEGFILIIVYCNVAFMDIDITVTARYNVGWFVVA